MGNILKLIPIILFFVIVSVNSTYIYASNSPNQYVIDIEISPESSVFNISGMVPGDWSTRELIIENNSSQDLSYLSKANFISGSKKLYDSLLLKISDYQGMIFEGKLHEFKKIDSRLLLRNQQEKLIYTIEMPYELGNEYQGLSSEFEFIFYVEGTLGGIIPVDNKLPVTATDMFNYILVGICFIIGGTVIYLYQRRTKADLRRT